jgi:hypothetical protein
MISDFILPCNNGIIVLFYCRKKVIYTPDNIWRCMGEAIYIGKLDRVHSQLDIIRKRDFLTFFLPFRWRDDCSWPAIYPYLFYA